jgi:hypothetical protein
MEKKSTTTVAILASSVIIVAGILFLFRWELVPVSTIVVRLDRLTGAIAICEPARPVHAGSRWDCDGVAAAPTPAAPAPAPQGFLQPPATANGAPPAPPKSE